MQDYFRKPHGLFMSPLSCTSSSSCSLFCINCGMAINTGGSIKEPCLLKKKIGVCTTQACGYPCMLRYMMETCVDEFEFNEKRQLLTQMANRAIVPAPQRRCLQRYGGYLSDEQFKRICQKGWRTSILSDMKMMSGARTKEAFLRIYPPSSGAKSVALFDQEIVSFQEKDKEKDEEQKEFSVEDVRQSKRRKKAKTSSRDPKRSQKHRSQNKFLPNFLSKKEKI